MSKAAAIIKRQRPERKLNDVLREHNVKTGKKPSALIDKQFTAMKAAEGTGDYGSGIFRPTDEQLEKINQFTRKAVTADDVVCFSTLSCNDMLDRDLDRFTSDCIDDFAALDGPLSSVGKSFMISHDYTKLPVGRIFDVDKTTIEGVKHLTNEVYLPNTEANKSYIENLEFGIYWAVSVGVVLEDSACAVCQSPMVGSYWTFCIENGHEKGLWYDPNSDEKDAWGWAEPVAEGTKGAVLCTRDLFSPKDFYELSQCFLGAQYDAAIQRGALKGIVKAASAAKTPILNLSSTEAKELPMLHVNDDVRKAYVKGLDVKSEKDGTLMWTDEHNLVWVFEPGEDEVLCLGKSEETDNESEEVNEDGEIQREQGSESGGQSQESDDGTALGEGGTVGEPNEQRSTDEDEPEGDDEESSSDSEGVASEEEASEEEEEQDDDEEESDETKSISKTAVLRAALNAKLPDDLVAGIQAAKGNGLDALLLASSKAIGDLETKVSELKPKAVLGEKYIDDKRAEAISWYVKARQAGKKEPVNTDRITRQLDRFGDDIDLIEEVIEEYKEIAREKFPQTARRSTAEQDHNVPDPNLAKIPEDREAAEKVRRVHG